MMSARVVLLLAGIFFFFSFIFFSYLVHEDLFTKLDFDTTVRLQDKISRRFDNEFSWFSEIGSFEFMLVALVIVAIALFVRKKILAGISAFMFFVGFHVIELFGKLYVEHLPPPHFMLRSKSLFEFPQFHVRSEFSYPSGHAGRAIFISSILLILIIFNKRLPVWLKALLSLMILAYDGIMLVSRVYLGEHWATDVVGGSLLGLALGLLTGGLAVQKQAKNKIPEKESKRKHKQSGSERGSRSIAKTG